MKKGRRATEASAGNVSSDSPSTPDYEANFQENALSDEFSAGLDLKGIPSKIKHRTGWTDEPVRSGSSGKYVKLNTKHCDITQFCNQIIFFSRYRSRNKPTQSEM